MASSSVGAKRPAPPHGTRLISAWPHRRFRGTEMRNEGDQTESTAHVATANRFFCWICNQTATGGISRGSYSFCNRLRARLEVV